MKKTSKPQRKKGLNRVMSLFLAMSIALSNVGVGIFATETDDFYPPDNWIYADELAEPVEHPDGWHEHDGSCFGWVLTCEYGEDECVHGEQCFVRLEVCGYIEQEYQDDNNNDDNIEKPDVPEDTDNTWEYPEGWIFYADLAEPVDHPDGWHEHDEDCLGWVLTCEYDEYDCEHDEQCFEQMDVCGYNEFVDVQPVVAVSSGLRIAVSVEGDNTVLPTDTVVNVTPLEVTNADGDTIPTISAQDEEKIFYQSLITDDASVLDVSEPIAPMTFAMPMLMQEMYDYKEEGEPFVPDDIQLGQEVLEEIGQEEGLESALTISVPLDITLTDSSGQEIQPEGFVSVSIEIPTGFDHDFVAVYHIGEDGEYTRMDGEVIGGHYVFKTDHFSRYTMVSSTKITDGTKLESNSSVVANKVQSLVGGNVYYISDTTVTITGQSGSKISPLTVASSATSTNPAVIFIPTGKTLTVTGSAGSGKTGGGAGIEMTSGGVLYVRGGGTLNATGGAAGSSVAGYDASDSIFNKDGWNGQTNKDMLIGSPGSGGSGGGGAGAGIGGKGGNGGAGGSSGGTIYLDCEPEYWTYMRNYSSSNNRGETLIYKGNNGTSAPNAGATDGATAMSGTIYVMDGIILNATGGAGTQATVCGSWGASDDDEGSGFTNNYMAGGSGGGGGGGAVGAGAGIGGGGGGGGGGGAGGHGASAYSGSQDIWLYAPTLTGGTGGNAGNNGVSGGSVYYDDKYRYTAAPGGDGGKNGTGAGASGTVNKSTYASVNNTPGTNKEGNNGTALGTTSVGTGDNSRYIVTLNANKPTSDLSVSLTRTSFDAQILSSTKYVSGSKTTVSGANITPSLYGYTFNGWYTATSGGTQIINTSGAFNSSVTNYTDSNGKWIRYDDLTLYAQWTPNKYRINTQLTHLNLTYVSGKEGPTETSAKVTITHATNVVATLAPSAGYKLPTSITVYHYPENATGRVDLVAGTGYSYNSTTGAITIYGTKFLGNVYISAAGVADTAPITLHTVGGIIPATAGWTGSNYKYVKQIGAEVELPTPELRVNGVVCNTVAFGGWYVSADYSGAAVTSISKEGIARDGKKYTELYAKWVYKATSENNGMMYYDYTATSKRTASGSIDVQGYSTKTTTTAGKWGSPGKTTTSTTKTPTTFENRGYEFYASVGKTAPTSFLTKNDIYSGDNFKFVTTTGTDIFKHLKDNIYIAQVATFNGNYTTVTYLVQNRGTSDVSDVSLGVAADVKINSDDNAAIMDFIEGDKLGYLAMVEGATGGKSWWGSNKGTVNKNTQTFRLYIDGEKYGVTPVDRYWIGYYLSGNKNGKYFCLNVYNKGTEWVKGDSALAFAWVDKTIDANSTRAFSYKLGVGTLEEMDVNTVSVVAKGGSFENGSDIINIPLTEENRGKGIDELLDGQEPVRDGFEFIGWSDVEDDDTVVYEKDEVLDLSDDIVIYPVWKSLSFDVTNQSVVTKGIVGTTSGDDKYETLPAATAQVFIKYDTDANKINQNATASDIVKPDKDFVATLGISYPTNGTYGDGDFLLPQTITVEVKDGNNWVALSEGTAYIYATWNNQQSADLLIPAQYLTGDVRVTAIAHPAPAVKPSITGITGDQELIYGYTSKQVKSAEVSSKVDKHNYTYQWYINTENENFGGTKITSGMGYSGNTGTTLTIPQGLDAGDYYYYCVVTATRTNGQVAVANSPTVTVNVVKTDATITYNELHTATRNYGDPVLIYSTLEGVTGGDEPLGKVDFHYENNSGEDTTRDNSERISYTEKVGENEVKYTLGASGLVQTADDTYQSLTQQYISYTLGNVVTIYLDSEGKITDQPTDDYYVLKYENQGVDKLASIFTMTSYTGTLAVIEHHYKENSTEVVESFNARDGIWARDANDDIIEPTKENPNPTYDVTIAKDTDDERTYTLGTDTAVFSVDYTEISTQLKNASFYKNNSGNDSYAIYLSYETVEDYKAYTSYVAAGDGNYLDGDSKPVVTMSTVLLTYDNNADDADGVIPAQRYYKDSTVDVKTGGYTRTNYVLQGWNTDSTATTISKDLNGDTITLNDDTTLYAIWEGEHHGVTLPSGSGFTSNGEDEAIYGTDYVAKFKPNPGYKYEDDSIKVIVDGVTLIEDDGYTITENDDGSYTIKINGDRLTGDVEIEFKTESIDATAATLATGKPEDVELTYGYSTGEGVMKVEVDTLPKDANDDDYLVYYQWYISDDNSNNTSSNDTSIDGATSAEFAIPAGKSVGTHYYYCKVTTKRIDNGNWESINSEVAKLTVGKATLPPATVSVDGWVYKTGTVGIPAISGYSGSESGVTYYYNTSDSTSNGIEWKNITNETLTPDNYYIYAVIAETDNYNKQTTTTSTFTVTKASLSNVTVSVSGWDYGGYIETDNKPVTKVDGTAQDSGVTYKYSSDGGNTWIEWDDSTYPASSLGAGSYQVKAVIDATSTHGATEVISSFTIGKATRTLGVSVADWTYDDNAESPSLSSDSTLESGEFATIKWRAAGGDTWETWGTYDGSTFTSSGTGAPTNAGSYTIRAEVAESDNYTSAIATSTFKITKASITDMDVTYTGNDPDGKNATITVTGWTYGDTDLPSPNPSIDVPSGITDNISGNITYYYIDKDTQGFTYPTGIDTADIPNFGSTLESAGWSTTMPSDAGDYYIIAVFTGTDNYAAAIIHESTGGGGDAIFTIEKGTLTRVSVSMADWEYGTDAASPTMDGVPSDNTATIIYKYTGTLADGTTYSESEDKPTAPGSYTVEASFTYNDNYNPTVVYDTFTITKGQLSATVSVSDIEYGEDVEPTATVTANGNTLQSGYGTLTYTYYTDSGLTTQTTTANGAESAGKAPKNAGTYYVKMDISANDNYSAATATTSFTISLAPTVSTVSVQNWLTTTENNKLPEPVVTVSDTTTPTANPVISKTGSEVGAITVSWSNGTDWVKWGTIGSDGSFTVSGTLGEGYPTVKGTYSVKVETAAGVGYGASTAQSTFAIIAQKINPTAHIEIDDTDWKFGDITPPTPELKGEYGSGTVTWSYSIDGTTWYEWGTTDASKNFTASTGEGKGAPTAAGEYFIRAVTTVSESYNAATIDKESDGTTAKFTIGKYKDDNIDLDLTGWDYGDTPNKPDVTGENSDGDVTYWYRKDGDTTGDWIQWIDGVTVPEDAGNYDIKIVISATDNYDEVVEEFDKGLTIGKSDLTASVSLDDWIYGDTPNAELISGNSGGGDVAFEYKKSGAADSTYSDEKPTAAGDYIVRAVIDESNNYNDTTVTDTFTINKATLLGSASVATDSFNYGGSSTPTVTVNIPNYNEQGTVTYTYGTTSSNATTAWSNVNTANCGTYTIKAVIPASDNYLETTVYSTFTITPVALTATAACDNWVYGGTAKTPTLSAPQGTSLPSPLTVTWHYSTDGTNWTQWGTSNGSGTVTGTPPTAAGNYQLRAVTSATTNYIATTFYTSFTISKGDLGANGVNVDSWVYGEPKNNPTVIGLPSPLPSGVDVEYFYKDGDEWKKWSDLPDDAPPGDYQIKVVIDGGDDYEDEELIGSFTILKKNISEDGQLIIEDWVYNGTPSNPITLTDATDSNSATTNVTYTYYDKNNTLLSGVPTDAGKYTIKAEVSDTNYTGTLQTEFEIHKASVTFDVTVEDIAFGGTFTVSNKVDGSQSSDVTYRYTGTTTAGDNYDSTTPPTKAGNYLVTATYAGDSNHAQATATDLFTITRAGRTASVSAKSWEYSGKADTPHNPVSITGNSENGDVTYYYSKYTGTTTPESITDDKWTVWIPATSTSGANPKEVGKYYVKAKIGQTDNYSAATVYNNFEITKANSPVTVEMSDWVYGSIAMNPDLKLNVSLATPTYTYYQADGTTLTNTADGATATGGEPKNAGNYVVKANVAGGGNYNAAEVCDTFSILKADRTGTSATKVTGWIYGEYTTATNSPTVTGDTEISNVKYYYSSDNSSWVEWGNDTAMKSISAGDYYLKAEVPATDNYNAVVLYNNFTVQKKTILSGTVGDKTGGGDIVATVTAKGWVYGKYSSSTNKPTISTEPVTTDIAGNTKFYYRPQNGTTWTEWTDDRAAKMDAGTYLIKAEIAATTNTHAATITTDPSGSPATLIVSKAEPNPVLHHEDWVVGETPNLPIVSDNAGKGAETFTYYLSDATTPTNSDNSGASGTNTIPARAGNYTTKAVIDQTTNYFGKTLYKGFSISKISIDNTSSLILVDDWVYSEDPIMPVLKVYPDGKAGAKVGEIPSTEYGEPSYYYSADGNNWSAWTDKSFPTAAGEYHVKADIPQSDSYHSASLLKSQNVNDSNITTFTISKRTPVISFVDTSLSQQQNSAGNAVTAVDLSYDTGSIGTLTGNLEYYVEDSSGAWAWTSTPPQTAGDYKVRAYLTGNDNNLKPTFTGTPKTDDTEESGIVYATLKVKAYVPPAPPPSNSGGKDKDKDKSRPSKTPDSDSLGLRTDSVLGNTSTNTVVVGNDKNLTPEILQNIKEVGDDVLYDLGDGVTVSVDPKDIPDNPKNSTNTIDLSIVVIPVKDVPKKHDDYLIPQQTVYVSVPVTSDYGVKVSLKIPKQKFADAGVDLTKTHLYVIEKDGKLKNTPYKINTDGDVIITINAGASYLFSMSGTFLTNTNLGDPEEEKLPTLEQTVTAQPLPDFIVTDGEYAQADTVQLMGDIEKDFDNDIDKQRSARTGVSLSFGAAGISLAAMIFSRKRRKK